MKKISLILSFLLFMSSFQSQAQEDFFTTEGVALSNLDQDLIAVSFLRANFGSRDRSFYIVVNQGQDCMNVNGIMNRVKFVKSCGGLLDENGEPIKIANYVKALNLLEKQGWKLLTIAVDTGLEGQSEPESHQYIFRKREVFSP
ncbi:MAG: hypothetical protein R8P61_26980 [Bacteroidia bacterium]|nr:hypothetical protein [Bacteroidia bacterium]